MDESNEFNQELVGLMEKHMPKQATDALLARLRRVQALEAQAAADQKTIHNLTVERDGLVKANQVLTTRLQGVEDREKIQDAREASQDARDKQLAAREREMVVDLLKKDVACQTEQKEFAKNIALGLVRNTEYRQSIYGSQVVPLAPVPSGGCPTYGNMGQGVQSVPVSTTVETKNE